VAVLTVRIITRAHIVSRRWLLVWFGPSKFRCWVQSRSVACPGRSWPHPGSPVRRGRALPVQKLPRLAPLCQSIADYVARERVQTHPSNPEISTASALVGPRISWEDATRERLAVVHRFELKESRRQQRCQGNPNSFSSR
jgi:hypothetical protein